MKKSLEQERMEAFYESKSPDYVRFFLSWEIDDDGCYTTDFATLAWGAWQQAQMGTAPVAKKKGAHRTAHPWRKTMEKNND